MNGDLRKEIYRSVHSRIPQNPIMGSSFPVIRGSSPVSWKPRRAQSSEAWALICKGAFIERHLQHEGLLNYPAEANPAQRRLTQPPYRISFFRLPSDDSSKSGLIIWVLLWQFKFVLHVPRCASICRCRFERPGSLSL